ncbi:hypothetical protein [Dichotomicrobium thermohalophilum]|uniref:Uncharacterized protein n=1 Tax=Dichotomicrobium thermohalophilum TaxID=933063 RepID=A0A397PAS0_9HYPH|nr:hypothetical protein [Dichotomicrobium thermohalophilum]RIA45483.1 hypothetical protein BXY53_2770 [Dichotomicrobium thermohalophilum]
MEFSPEKSPAEIRARVLRERGRLKSPWFRAFWSILLSDLTNAEVRTAMIVLGHADSGTAAGARPSQQTIAAIRRTDRKRVKAELRSLETAKVLSARREGDGRGRKVTYDFIPDQTVKELERAMAKDGDTHEAAESTWGQAEPKAESTWGQNEPKFTQDDAIAPGDTPKKERHSAPRSENEWRHATSSRNADDGRGAQRPRRGATRPQKGGDTPPRSAPDLPPTFSRAHADGAAAPLGTPHAPSSLSAGVWYEGHVLKADNAFKAWLRQIAPEIKPHVLLQKIGAQMYPPHWQDERPHELERHVRYLAPRVAAAIALAESFAAFWKRYPVKKKGRREAEQLWAALSEDERRAATEAIPDYIAARDSAGHGYADAQTYLRERHWQLVEAA